MLVGSLAGLATQIINLFCPEQSLSLSFSLQFHSNNQQLWAICEIFISVPMAAFQHSHATHQTQMGVFVFSDQYWLGFIFLLDWYKYLYRGRSVCQWRKHHWSHFSPELPSWWTAVSLWIPCWNNQPASYPRTTYRNTSGDSPARNHSWNYHNFRNCPDHEAKELLE